MSDSKMYLVSDRRMEVVKVDAGSPAKNRVGGFGGWLLDAVGRLMAKGAAARKRASGRKMHVVETLAMGAKKQLLLVNCGDELFLVGTGPENVSTIVRVRPDGLADYRAMPRRGKQEPL